MAEPFWYAHRIRDFLLWGDVTTESHVRFNGERMALLPTVPGKHHDCYPIDDSAAIRSICDRLGASVTKGELARNIACEVEKYLVFDLQVICGRLHHEIEHLPSPYREAVRPFFIEQTVRDPSPFIADDSLRILS